MLNPRRVPPEIGVPLLALLLFGGFVALRLAKLGGDASGFVVAGQQFCDPAAAPQSLRIAPGAGYDGQFFYRLALRPWTTEATAFGITLDAPPYRQQRILYPAVAWLLAAAGQAALVPAALIAVNLLALVVLARIGVALAQALGGSGWLGLLLVAYPGFVLALARCTAEPLAAALLAGALLALLHRKHVPAALLLTAAVLTKETAVGAAVAVLMAAVVTAPRSGRRIALLALPVIAYVTLQGAMFLTWNQWPLDAGSGNVGTPFAGVADFVGTALRESGARSSLWRVELLFLGLFHGLAAVRLLAGGAPLVARLGWLAYLTLALVLTDKVWCEDWAFLRALSELHIFGAVLLLRAGPAVPAALAAALLTTALAARASRAG